nr:hypothetical protein [Tolivirales sp.]
MMLFTNPGVKFYIMPKNKSKKSKKSRAVFGRQRTVATRLPSPFNHLASDSTTVKARGILTLKAFSNSYAGGTLGLWPMNTGGSTPNSLYTLVPSLGGFSNMYEYFIVNNISVTAVSTTPMTVGSVLAVGYEPDITTDVVDPATLQDVMISKHHVLVQQGSKMSMSLKPISYRNDWCSTTAAATQPGYGQNGYLQWFSTYFPAADAVVGYLDISFEITFAGLHNQTSS